MATLCKNCSYPLVFDPELQIPLKQHADSDRTACCSASRGTE